MKKSSAQCKQEALDAFIGHKTRIDEILSRLQDASDDHFGSNPDEILWGALEAHHRGSFLCS